MPPQLKISGRKGEESVHHDPEWVRKFQKRGSKLQREASNRVKRQLGKSMQSGQDALRPAITMEEMQANLERTKDAKWSHTGTPGAFPGAGKDGKGIIWPVEDFDYDEILTKLEYEGK